MPLFSDSAGCPARSSLVAPPVDPGPAPGGNYRALRAGLAGMAVGRAFPAPAPPIASGSAVLQGGAPARRWRRL